MPEDVFRAALEQCGEFVVLGGGEPTVHPLFYQFMLMAISSVYSVLVLTNGKITETALMLANLNKLENVSCLLSVDRWHEPVAPEVYDAFYAVEATHNVGERLRPDGKGMELREPIRR
jgi:MoaA/NifB/PqqE/SkfB family radical SAM enzyme